MPNCPTCKVGLQTARQRDGIYYYCDQCNGRAATMPQIRRVAGDLFASGLLLKMSTATQASWLTCPFCDAQMKSFHVSDPPLSLDSCKSCGAIWFEPGKFEILPQGAIESGQAVLLTPVEAKAKQKMEQEATLGEDYLVDPPKEIWKWIPGILFFPLRDYRAETLRRPWTLWLLSTIIFIVSVCTFPNLENVVEKFGLVPAHAFRHEGATFVTAFFLHGGWMHLVGNLWFFLLFGAEVEDFLGWWRFLVLVFLSAFAGDMLHILGDVHSDMPCIGASGGISGVMVFYAFQFPKARIRFLFFPMFVVMFLLGYARWWFRLPAWTAFAIWVLLQVRGALIQLAGFGTVSSLAHLGGVLTGFVLWHVWRKKESTVYNPQSTVQSP